MPPTRLARLTLLILAAVPPALAATQAAATPLPRPELIAAAVRVHGAPATVAALLANSQWNPLVAQIGAGNADWIALAPKLAPGTTPATSLSLDLVLARALTLNAPAVLSVLDPSAPAVLAASRVCAAPVLTLSMQQLASYQASAVEAVEQVATPTLAPARAACLHALTGSGADTPIDPQPRAAHLTRATFRAPPIHLAPRVKAQRRVGIAHRRNLPRSTFAR